MNFIRRQLLLIVSAAAIVIIGLIVACGSGGYAPSEPLSFLYVSNFNGNSVSVYQINGATGIPTPVLSSPFSAGTGTQYVYSEPTDHFLYASNASSSDFSIFAINPTSGALTSIVASFSYPNPPGAIASAFNGEYLYATDNITQVAGFKINSNTGTLSELPLSPYSAGAGGSSHLSIDPLSKYLVVSNNAAGTVTVLSINPNTGVLTINGSAVATGTTPQKSAFDVTGKFFYVVNQGSNSITGFTFSSAGVLTPIAAAYPTDTSPSAVAIDPYDRFVYTSNYSGPSISIFTMNSNTGVLTPAGTLTATGTPIALTVDATGHFLYMVNRSNLAAYLINQATGSLTALPGSPYSTGSLPYMVYSTRISQPRSP